MRKHTQLILWLALVTIPTWVLWYEGWPAIPILQMGAHNVPYSIAAVWAMWYAHEKFGWFGGRPSEAESPRMHYHPHEDRP